MNYSTLLFTYWFDCSLFSFVFLPKNDIMNLVKKITNLTSLNMEV